MQTVERLDPLRSAVRDLRKAGPLALVPTMGALHDGHLTLVRAARERAAHVAVSIFVNPRQFGRGEDLDSYPRPRERDLALLEAEGVSLVWAPAVEEMYPAGYATNISVSGISEGLCGASRPGHFDGVATVVCKLFNQVRPDLDLIRPHADRIVGVPTVREADGLAMSSRNAYLTPDERTRAAALPAAMRDAIARIEAGEAIAPVLLELQDGLRESGFASVDYAELCDADSLVPLPRLGTAPARLLVAARIGRARLIDNMPVGG
jgi:pantoate--beta-alanine ligase